MNKGNNLHSFSIMPLLHVFTLIELLEYTSFFFFFLNRAFLNRTAPADTLESGENQFVAYRALQNNFNKKSGVMSFFKYLYM